ncbi:hypothetical protein [uncultured Nostoc sp.]|uniref:hypothetical protein n=1 Tax=uncultured Nostoc sp. TaxID=340711 RepID=UPI0035CA2CFF
MDTVFTGCGDRIDNKVPNYRKVLTLETAIAPPLIQMWEMRSLSQFLQNQALLSNLCSFCSTMK